MAELAIASHHLRLDIFVFGGGTAGTKSLRRSIISVDVSLNIYKTVRQHLVSMTFYQVSPSFSLSTVPMKDRTHRLSTHKRRLFLLRQN